MGLISSALHVRPGEGRPVGLLFALSFCCGTATVCFESAAASAFLDAMDARQLALVYMLSALVTSAIGWVYIRMERRLPLERLLKGALGLLLASVLSFRLLLLIFEGRWLPFTMFLWFDVLTMVANLATWGLTIEVLTVRQGKRLFGPINAGEQLAGTLVGLGMGALVGALGTENLLLVSATGLAVAIGVMGSFLDRYGEGFRSEDEPGEDEEDGEAEAGTGPVTPLRTLLQSPLLTRVFLLSALTVIGFYALEYLVYQQIETRFGEDRDATAAFIGNATGVANLLTLLGAWFVSGRLLERFGVRVALLVLPVALALGTLAALALGLSAGLGGAFFWVVVATRVLDTFLRGTVEDETMLVLYQPLEPGQRAAAQARAEGLVEPMAAMAAGLFQVGVLAISEDPRVFLASLSVPIALWVFVSWDTGRAYAAALVQAIDRRVLTGRTLRLADASTLDIFQSRLASPHPGEVLFCLQTLERIEHPRYDVILLNLLDHPSPAVRREVLLRLERRRPPSAAAHLLARTKTEADVEVRATAFRVLCAVAGPDTHAELVGAMDDPVPLVRQAVVLGLLRSADLGAVVVAADRLARMAGSAFSADRILAAELLGELASPTAHTLLRPMLADRDAAVARQALLSAGRLRHPALWATMIARLGHPGLSASAAEALSHVGAAVVPRLDEALVESGQSRLVRVRIARLCGRIPGPTTVRVLKGHLDERDAGVRGAVLQSLALCAYRATASELPALQRVVLDEVRIITRVLATFLEFPEEPHHLYLRSALREEIHQARRRIFWVLSFLYDPKNMLLARDSLDHPSAQRRAWAVEVVDLQLAPELRPVVLPLLEDHEDADRLARLETRFPQPRLDRVGRLRELIARDDASTSLWTRLCAVRVAVALEARSLWDAIEPLLASREPVLRETGLWALTALDPRRAREPVRALRADPHESVSALAEYVLSDMSNEAPMLLTVEKVIILKSVSIFSRTPEEVLVDVASVLKEVDVKKGETIFEKGDIGTSMYFIVAGRLRVHDGEVTVAELGEREIVGELAVLDPQPRNASVTALEDTVLLQLDQEALYELMTDRVEVARGIIRVLCHKLRMASLAAAQKAEEGQ